jgi:predicted deacylase
MAPTATRTPRNRPVEVAGTTVAPGRRQLVEVPVARLPTATRLNLPIIVLNGLRPGPKLWLSAVVHGDELNGLEIIRRVLEVVRPRRLAGMLLAVPVVNVFGMVTETRYLPDRRDLNRSFPGSPKGSLAAQLANLFMTNVVAACDMGIDLHTGSDHRFNLPQIRGDLEDPTTLRLARAFGAPVSVHAPLRDGSLREACRRRGIPVVVYEGASPTGSTRPPSAPGSTGCCGCWPTWRCELSIPHRPRPPPRSYATPAGCGPDARASCARPFGRANGSPGATCWESSLMLSGTPAPP